jgi:hypothetical protein
MANTLSPALDGFASLAMTTCPHRKYLRKTANAASAPGNEPGAACRSGAASRR